MPSPKQIFLDRGFAGLALAGSPFRGAGLAQDAAMPRAALAGAAGAAGGPRARDQEPDDDNDNVTVAETPAAATFARLHKILAAALSPEDLDAAEELIQQLFADTDPTNGNGNGGAGGSPGIATDRRPTPGYSKHFPNAHRLGKQALTGVTGSSGMAGDRGASSGYSQRFPNAGRLVRTF